MTANTAPQFPIAAVGETRAFAIGFIDVLDSGELLSGTPTVAEVTTADLTLTQKRVNTATISINGVDHLAGQAVQFLASGFVAGRTYEVRATCATNATYPQTLIGTVKFRGVAA